MWVLEIKLRLSSSAFTCWGTSLTLARQFLKVNVVGYLITLWTLSLCYLLERSVYSCGGSALSHTFNSRAFSKQNWIKSTIVQEVEWATNWQGVGKSRERGGTLSWRLFKTAWRRREGFPLWDVGGVGRSPRCFISISEIADFYPSIWPLSLHW